MNSHQRSLEVRAGPPRPSQRNGLAISPRKHRVGPSVEANETSVQLQSNVSPRTPKHHQKSTISRDQRARRINKIENLAKSAKPPSPVQIRAAPPIFLRKITRSPNSRRSSRPHNVPKCSQERIASKPRDPQATVHEGFLAKRHTRGWRFPEPLPQGAPRLKADESALPLVGAVRRLEAPHTIRRNETPSAE